MFTIQSSLFNNQYSIFGLGCSQFKISMFRCSHFMSLFTVHGSFTIQCSLFKCSKLMFKSYVQAQCSNAEFKVPCPCSVFNDGAWVSQAHKCMSGVHVSIDLQCWGVSQCALSGSLVHVVTPNDDQVPCTNCSPQVIRYSC